MSNGLKSANSPVEVEATKSGACVSLLAEMFMRVNDARHYYVFYRRGYFRLNLALSLTVTQWYSGHPAAPLSFIFKKKTSFRDGGTKEYSELVEIVSSFLSARIKRRINFSQQGNNLDAILRLLGLLSPSCMPSACKMHCMSRMLS